LIGNTQKTWWSSRLRPRHRGSALRLIASNAAGVVLFLLLASHPAAAAGDELQVIAVHTASAPLVSMVVEPPVTPPQNGSAAESCSVTIYGKPVATTVSPMASGDLSVALVIDTASGLTSQELAAVQNGATEFLLRLPDGAHSMVVTAAGQPEVVAPLSEHRAEALSAISALRVGGSRATMAATMLAAQSLESAPPGSRAIIVYTQGLDEQGALTDRLRLSQAVLHSEAVLNVIQTGTDTLWPSVVDQAGGVVVTTIADDIVQSFGDLAATLDDQYVVTFEAPGELPAVAQVAFQIGDQEYRTVVNLPHAGASQAAPTESSGGSPDRGVPGLVAPLVAVLVLTALAMFLRRARQLRHADGGEPSTRVASPATGAPPSDEAASASPPQTAAAWNAPLPEHAASSPPTADNAAPSAPVPTQAAPSTPPLNQPAVPTVSLPDDPTQNDPPRRPPISPVESRPARRSLSAAIEGRRLARLILDSQPELRPEPAEQRGQADNNQAEEPLADQQARYPAEGRSTASGSEAGTKTEGGRPENPAEGDPS
jgi:von Willebrand factor type A domain